jgi:hypothetical protein
MKGNFIALMILGAAVHLLPVSAASAQTQPTTWQGSFTIRALSATCDTEDGIRVGKIGIAIYRPTLGASGPSRLQLIFERSAANYQKSGAGQMQGPGSYSATKLGSRAGVQEFTGTYNFASAPATVVASTVNVTLTGTINNFHNKTGCTATLTALFTKRPAGE